VKKKNDGQFFFSTPKSKPTKSIFDTYGIGSHSFSRPSTTSKMTIGRKSAIVCLSLSAALLATRLQTSAAFTSSRNVGVVNTHKSTAMNKITSLSSQRSASTECPEIPTVPRNPSNEVAILASG
jgi:hypothetical protein